MDGISHKNRPQLVYRYIRTIEPTVKKRTWQGMLSSLSQFHSWLSKNRIPLDKLNREFIISWLNFLNKKDYSSVTIRTKVNTLHRYLCWLSEESIITADPMKLILKTDLPKLPSYLPRPLSKEVDFELQKRLRVSESHLHHDLFLMRKIGVRISELINLECNCLHHDHKDSYFIKVPLGKLYNERFVPLDNETLDLVWEIQARNNFDKTWLVEYKPGIRPTYSQYSRALDKISKGLDSGNKITTHRLRHTFASSLLNGGMSLVGVMKLLGHRSPKMTLRYAAVTQETVCEQYYAALSRYESKYTTELKKTSTQAQRFDPVSLLEEVILWVKKTNSDSTTHHNDAQLLYRRLNRAKQSLEILVKSLETPKE